MKHLFLIPLLLSLFPCLLFGQVREGISFGQAEENLLNQLAVYPQEKIHLHTDRDFYVPGEKIWFKAYLTDAATHQSPTYSRYVYAELIDSSDSLVSRVMIRPIDGLFYGHLFLSEIIPEGNYTLRAYTRYMENLGDDYFFKKNIRIGNLSAEVKQPTNNKQPSKVDPKPQKGKTAQDDFEVTFFPEGGNLPEGVSCRVAFKALNRTGYPETVSGKIVDETGDEITPVTTLYAGMGMFSYVPRQDKKYYLKCQNGNGLEKQFELPQSDTRAYSLIATKKNNKILIGIQKAVGSSAIPCYLLIHNRGLPLYFSAWDNEKDFVPFAEEQFPSGIIQFVLFDGQMNPLSERLVFSKNKDNVKVGFHTDKASYEKRENIVTTLTLTDTDGNPLTGHLSVAVTDDKDIEVDSSTTILSSLLLSSELKGYIENPAYYLRDNPESTIALDYLMMTHGWRRYNIPEVVKGNFEHPQISYQTSQEIAGEVKSVVRSKPVTDSDVSILTKDGGFGMATTDEKGRFVFRDFEYPDSTSFHISAVRKKGSSEVKLDLDRESFPSLIYASQSPVTTIKETIKDAPEKDAFITKAEERSKYDAGMRMVYLSEVVVIAPKIEKRNEPRLRFPLNQGSDVTIRREDFEYKHPIRVSDVLLGIRGIQMNCCKVSIRGMGLPLVLIDGFPVEWDCNGCLDCCLNSPLETIPIEFVASIDVFINPAVLFGVRGVNGVISITTRTGEGEEYSEKEIFNYATHTPLGYQKPAEFYAPHYDTLEAKQSVIPDCRTTLFWKPDVVVSDTGETSFDFYAADFPTTYSVVLEGLTTDGRIIRQVEKISVGDVP